MRRDDWGFDIDIHDNKLIEYDNAGYYDDGSYDLNDRPDVEFNDDRSVHINTPGHYTFSDRYGDHFHIVRAYNHGRDECYASDNLKDPALD